MHQPATHLNARQRLAVAVGSLLAVSLTMVVFMLYLRPDFIVDLATRWSLC